MWRAISGTVLPPPLRGSVRLLPPPEGNETTQNSRPAADDESRCDDLRLPRAPGTWQDLALEGLERFQNRGSKSSLPNQGPPEHIFVYDACDFVAAEQV
jgi:hypothetical protein